MCVLYKGKPNGLAHIQYTDPYDKYNSFEGISVFTDGKLHMGPITFIKGDGCKE